MTPRARRLARAPRSEAPRVRTHARRIVALLTALAVVVGGISSGAAWALWSDSFTNPSLQAATGSKVGISLGRVGQSATAATGAGSVLTETLSRADGQSLLAAPGRSIAIPLVVRMRADGNAGTTYDIALPAFAAGTLFAASTVRLFALASTTDAAAQAACTTAAAPGTQPSTTGVVGIAAGNDPTAPQGVAVDYWCLTAVYSGTGGTYQNTATARGTAPSGATAEGQSSWTAYVIAPGTYSLTHQIRLPGSP